MFEALRKKLASLRGKGAEVVAEHAEEPETEVAREEVEQEVAQPAAQPPAAPAEKKRFFFKKEPKEKESKAQPETSVEGIGDTGKKISEEKLDDLLWELEMGLLEADVALPVIEEIKNGVRDDLVGRRIGRGYDLGEAIEQALRNAIANVLQKSEFDFDGFVRGHDRPVVIMFVGINGTGKTTAIAKIADRLHKNGMTTVLSASDTFRAGAIEQLSVHAERLGTKIIKHQSGGDPAAVAYDAVEHAKAKHRDVVLIDTAGRMQTNVNLMDEMKKIKRVVSPHLIIFVGDSLAGNDAVEQAVAFDKAVGIDAIILTKIDADAKGGAALSIAHAIGKPIAFVSNGQGYEDIIPFDGRWMLDRLFEE
ncbi:MAG: signal recognition particle-docking protein FtsY [Methanomassiliicoccaceae archaeon]|jgi:fused signal recognition particle receptor|nr:signal recognition particle-docking protein FtsY [Methanomassiliicoccaceae archaeon]HQD88333.1 signal recognition particle-docking protein FtsY [Methanomassiliicoccaceae archaeon]